MPPEQDVDYTPYGSIVDGTASEHYLFTGQERDSESNLDYFVARHYASAKGRFMVPDPSGAAAADPSNPQSWNLYAYALNNPLRFIDPYGLDCVYLNNGGTDVDRDGNGVAVGVDTNSTREECMGDANGNGGHGGFWVDGTLTQVNLFSNSNDVSLGGTVSGPDGQVATGAVYTTVTDSDQQVLTSMGLPNLVGKTVDLVQLSTQLQFQQRNSLFGTIEPTPRLYVAGDCAAGAGGKLAKDLTGMSTVKDVVDAVVDKNFKPLVSTGNALDAAEKAGEGGAKILKGTAGKVMGGIGKTAGRLGKAYSVAKAGMSFAECMGW